MPNSSDRGLGTLAHPHGCRPSLHSSLPALFHRAGWGASTPPRVPTVDTLPTHSDQDPPAYLHGKLVHRGRSGLGRHASRRRGNGARADGGAGVQGYRRRGTREGSQARSRGSGDAITDCGRPAAKEGRRPGGTVKKKDLASSPAAPRLDQAGAAGGRGRTIASVIYREEEET